MVTSKYYLQNEVGQRMSLNVGESMFMDKVEGLGVETDFSYADFSNGFAKLTSEDYKQTTVVGRINFMENAFSLYRSLIDFMMSSVSLYFIYKPEDVYEYYREVKLQSISKSARAANGTMSSDITLTTLSPWYLPTPSKTVVEVTDVDVFRYPFTYGVTRYASSIAGTCTANIVGKGHTTGQFEFSYSGLLVNPKLTLTGDSGKVYGVCDIEATIGVNERLEISTRTANKYVRKIDSSGNEVDLIEYVDAAQNPYPKIPVTENCVLELTSTSPMSGKANLTVYYFYRSV